MELIDLFEINSIISPHVFFTLMVKTVIGKHGSV